MTQALSAAVASAANLPEEEQNVLEQMASEAIQDFQHDRVQPIDELQLTQLRLISSGSFKPGRPSKGVERSGAPTNSGERIRPNLPSDSRRSIQHFRSTRPVSISTGGPATSPSRAGSLCLRSIGINR